MGHFIIKTQLSIEDRLMHASFYKLNLRVTAASNLKSCSEVLLTNYQVSRKLGLILQ